MRTKGLIPAVIYGPGIPAHPLSLDARELKRLLGSEAGMNVLITLKVEEESELNDKVVMLREVQRDPLQGHYLHADLQQVFMDRKVTATVPIHLVGRAEGDKDGGVVQPGLRSVGVKCLPVHLPDYLEVDITALSIGDTIHVRDLTLPEGVEVEESAEQAVVTVLPPTVVEAEAPPAAEEAPPPTPTTETEEKGE